MLGSNFRINNRLLKALTSEGFSRLIPHMELVELPAGHQLVAGGKPILHLCFIESGLASTVVHNDGGKGIDTALVGREGVTGWPVLLGAETTPDETVMCVGGRGLMIPAVEIRREMEENPRLRELLLGYINICLLQVGQLVLANGQYSLRERLARWLLMCHDRLDTDDLPITHEFLATVLGVRRPGITNELHVLEGIHAIRASRGNVRVINRRVLEEVADVTYGVPEKEYERLITQMLADVATPSVFSV
ncbi:Crp/Fnr family transcriptional regulator [Rhizobium rhizogenes]|uniref:Crp/Fnr family transcriptional regulator n=1 Tax=Rhizobium rhizogenes TaxID=359 RepID=UPI0022BD76E9|nr:Crp/Fnr family transcriptional regulator [Rhizobium rhizogenes]MCZ7486155.1 Crp/Fnr family transcriptional regulator [Rhizobium rhizogenes]